MIEGEELTVDRLKAFMREVEYLEKSSIEAELDLQRARDVSRRASVSLDKGKMELFEAVCLVINERDTLIEELAAQRANDREIDDLEKKLEKRDMELDELEDKYNVLKGAETPMDIEAAQRAKEDGDVTDVSAV